MVDLDDDAGQICCICHMPLLSHAVAAPKCGHLHHYHCLNQWLSTDRQGRCTVCNRPCGSADDLRVLQFIFKRQDQLAVAEEGDASDLEESASQQEPGKVEAAHKALLQKLEEECQALEEEVKRCEEQAKRDKEERKLSEAAATRLEEESLKLQRSIDRQLEDTAKLQADCDKHESGLKRIHSVKRPTESDHDLREERKMLKVMRPQDRAKQLHEALEAAMKQEAEGGKALRGRNKAVEEQNKELAELRRHEAKLRQDLEEQRRKGKVAPCEAVAVQPEPSPLKEEVVLQALIEDARPCARVVAAPAIDNSDAFLFGGAAQRVAGRGPSVFGGGGASVFNAANRGSGVFGAAKKRSVFGGGTSQGSPPPLPPDRPRQGGGRGARLEAMFANRKA